MGYSCLCNGREDGGYKDPVVDIVKDFIAAKGIPPRIGDVANEIYARREKGTLDIPLANKSEEEKKRAEKSPEAQKNREDPCRGCNVSMRRCVKEIAEENGIPLRDGNKIHISPNGDPVSLPMPEVGAA